MFSWRDIILTYPCFSAGAIFVDENKFSGAWNEIEYTFFFIYPLLKQALHNVPFEFRLGESHLKCAIKNTNDDEAAESGPKIDIIMYYKRLDLAMSVVEVSGPNHKVNKNHCLGDRVKIAKILKSILKAIEKSTKTLISSHSKRSKCMASKFTRTRYSFTALQEPLTPSLFFFAKRNRYPYLHRPLPKPNFSISLASPQLASLVQRNVLKDWWFLGS